MHERLNKVRKENPRFNEELVDYFGDIMPELLEVYIDGYLYDDHIGSRDVALMAEQFIRNDKGEYIEFRWGFEDVINIAKSFINLDDMEFYPEDLWVWANVKYGDMGHIIADTSTIIRYAIAELTDEDYPFCPASHRAFEWLKKHVINNNNR